MNYKQYFRKFWVPIVIVIGLVLFFVIRNLLDRNYYILLVALFAVVTLGPIVLFVIWWNTGGGLAAMFKGRSTQPFYDWYDKLARMAPERRTGLTLHKGFVSALYGEFEKTQQALQSVQWERESLYMQSQGILVETLLEYFQTKNYERGYDLAVRAHELGKIDRNDPEYESEELTFGIHIAIGNVLRGKATAETVEILEKAKQKLTIFGKLLAAWGLEHAYRQSGDNARADEMHKFITSNAPYCKSLLNTA